MKTGAQDLLNTAAKLLIPEGWLTLIIGDAIYGGTVAEPNLGVQVLWTEDGNNLNAWQTYFPTGRKNMYQAVIKYLRACGKFDLADAYAARDPKDREDINIARDYMLRLVGERFLGEIVHRPNPRDGVIYANVNDVEIAWPKQRETPMFDDPLPDSMKEVVNDAIDDLIPDEQPPDIMDLSPTPEPKPEPKMPDPNIQKLILRLQKDLTAVYDEDREFASTGGRTSHKTIREIYDRQIARLKELIHDLESLQNA